MPPTTTKADSNATLRDDSTRQTLRPLRKERTATPPWQVEAVKKEVLDQTEADSKALLASIFRSDLEHMRTLVTCSVCDQLLYEPFTIQCGHTYCYSCLCSWFTPNKSNKTCPECRTAVKHIPAPSFMIKQLVETFTKRFELMPPDESVEQHIKKRAEEVAAVEEDRNSERGLFKGLFAARSLLHDEADGVHRCPTCHTEYVGGSTCLTCGTEIDGDDFDFSGDDFDLDGLDEDLDLEEELELELAERRFTNRGPHVPFHRIFGGRRHLRFGGRRDRAHEDTPSVTSDSEDSRDFDRGESDSEEGSIRDFIVNDDSPESRRDTTPNSRRRINRVQAENSPYDSVRGAGHINPSNDSEDESDEDVVQPGRRNRSGGQGSQVVDLTEDDDDDTDEENVTNTSDRLRDAGWSPLHENDHDESDGRERDASDVSDHSNDLSSVTDEDDSDTETMMGNDDVRPQRSFNWNPARSLSSNNLHVGSQDDHSEMSSNMDEDGDTEMSVSPVSREGYRGDYGDYPDTASSDGEEYNNPYDRDPYRLAGNPDLGESHALHELDDESDESSSPPVRLRARSQQVNSRRNYSPRISQMIATHQSIRQGSYDSGDHVSGLEELDPALSESSENSRVEYYPEISINRSHTHQFQPFSSARPSLAPSQSARFRHHSATIPVPRIISSSSRPSRVERRYHGDVRAPYQSRYYM